VAAVDRNPILIVPCVRKKRGYPIRTGRVNVPFGTNEGSVGNKSGSFKEANGASFSVKFSVSGDIQGKLDGPFSGMLWRQIVWNRKLVSNNSHRQEQVLERPQWIYWL
jgi:hypothetical protein